MKLSDFENSINPVIMERGEDYHDSDAVKELEETEPHFWQAWVEGSHHYDIEISLNKQTIEDWHCSCPYDGPVCKHVAATLLSIRKATAALKKSKKKRLTKQQQLNNVLEQLNQTELKNCLSQLLKNDRAARDRMLLQFQHYTGSSESTVTRYRGLFKKLVSRYSSHGFIDYREARGFTLEAYDLLDSLDPSTMPPNDCVDSCFAFFEILENDVAGSIDDSDGGTGDLMSKAADILKHTFEQLTDVQKAECFKQVLYWDFESELKDYGLGQYLDELTPQWASTNTELQAKYLDVLEKTLATSSDKWQRDLLNRQKLNALSDWGRHDEASEFAKAKMDIPEFRRLFIDKAIQGKEFTQARALIDEGIQIATNENHSGTVSDWRKLLLEIAEQTGDTSAVREELIKLQRNSWFKISYYRKLKATFSSDEWESVRQGYAKQMLGERHHVQVDAQAEIFLEENELRELFDLIRAQEHGAASMFRRYIDILAPVFPEETAECYDKVIRLSLKATGRSVYEQAVREIKHLQQLPWGNKIADKLIKDVMLEYKNRPSMLEIFRQAFDLN